MCVRYLIISFASVGQKNDQHACLASISYPNSWSSWPECIQMPWTCVGVRKLRNTEDCAGYQVYCALLSCERGVLRDGACTDDPNTRFLWYAIYGHEMRCRSLIALSLAHALLWLDTARRSHKEKRQKYCTRTFQFCETHQYQWLKSLWVPNHEHRIFQNFHDLWRQISFRIIPISLQMQYLRMGRDPKN